MDWDERRVEVDRLGKLIARTVETHNRDHTAKLNALRSPEHAFPETTKRGFTIICNNCGSSNVSVWEHGPESRTAYHFECQNCNQED